MLKVTAIGYRPVKDDVVVALQRAGVLEIEQSPFEELETAELHPDDPRVRLSEEEHARMQFVRDFLGRHHVGEQPFSMFVSEKFHLGTDEFHRMTYSTRDSRLYNECVSLSDRLAHGEREIHRLEQLISDLTPWELLRLQISEWQGTERTALFAGTVPAGESRAIRQTLREVVDDVTVEELPPTGALQAWMVIVHRSAVDEVRTALASTAFTEVHFEGATDYPAEEIAKARHQISRLETESAELTARARELSAAHYHDSVALVQALDSQRERIAVLKEVSVTESTFVITGWLPESREEELTRSLARFVGNVDVTLESPAEDEEPPVHLQNPRWLQPFEILTDLYGRPRYRDADPTPLLAPFFLLFFAICIGDFGYGLMLLAGAFLVKTRLDVAPGVKRFMDLLMLGGVGSMVVGVLLGGYLAIPVDKLPQVLQNLQVLDPIEDVQQFLLFALILGVVQVFFGVILAATYAFRRGDAASAIFDHISILVMFGLIGIAVVTGEMAWLVAGLVFATVAQGRAITAALGEGTSPIWDRALGWAWLASVVWFVAAFAYGGVQAALIAFLVLSIGGPFISQTVRKAVLGMLGGAYSVYGMTGFVGDVLSYLRLAALGLSSTLVGWVFNILAGLVWDAASPMLSSGGLAILGGVLVVLAGTAVFAVGHVFNVVINLLGAFVHPARLQFVEFFSKFYEAGGRNFAPFRYRTENLVLGASGAEGEGGSS